MNETVTPDELRACASGDWRRRETYYEARRLLRAAAHRIEELESELTVWQQAAGAEAQLADESQAWAREQRQRAAAAEARLEQAEKALRGLLIHDSGCVTDPPCGDCGYCRAREALDEFEGAEADRPEDLPAPANADRRFDEMDGG